MASKHGSRQHMPRVVQSIYDRLFGSHGSKLAMGQDATKSTKHRAQFTGTRGPISLNCPICTPYPLNPTGNHKLLHQVTLHVMYGPHSMLVICVRGGWLVRWHGHLAAWVTHAINQAWWAWPMAWICVHVHCLHPAGLYGIQIWMAGCCNLAKHMGSMGMGIQAEPTFGSRSGGVNDFGWR